MSRTRVLWTTAVVVVALVVVVSPVMLPRREAPDVTSTMTPQASLTTGTTPPTTTTTEADALDSGGTRWEWTRIDPETLEDVASTPLLVGSPGRSVFSPDGHTVASFIYSSSDNSEDLVIADLEQGRVRSRLPLEGWVVNDQSGLVDGPLQAMFIAADAVTWIAQLPAEYGSGPVAEDYALFRYHLGETRPELVYAFPEAFAPWETRHLSHDRLAVFGSPVVFDDETPDDDRWPRLLVVDARTGLLEWEVQIPGLVAGHHWKRDQVGIFMHPGLGWDLAGERLYIAHADRPAVTVVDLSRGELIGEQAIDLASSIRQRLMLWLLPTAQAKLQESTRLNVRVDPGGERLYLSGVRWELVHNDQGEAVNDRQVAMGLRVLDLPTLETISFLDLPVSDVEISSDGSLLLLTGVWDGQVVDSDPEQSGLYVLHAETLEERAHLWPGTIPWIHGYTDDGESAYLTVWDEQASLLLLDLSELVPIAERVLSDNEQASFELPRRGLTAIWAGE